MDRFDVDDLDEDWPFEIDRQASHLFKHPRYVGADIIEGACERIPVLRGAIGPDCTIADTAIREQIANALTTLARHAADASR